MSVLDRSELEASPLADLHAIADQLGLDGFRRLRKAELIGAILGEPGGAAGGNGQDSDAFDKDGARGESEGGPSDWPALQPSKTAVGGARKRRGPRLRRGTKEGAEGTPATEREPSRSSSTAAPSRGGGGAGEREGNSSRSGRSAAQPNDRPEAAQSKTVPGDTAAVGDGRSTEGVVELLGNGSAFLRVDPPEPSDEDVYISAAQVRRCELVSGDRVTGPVRTPRRSERYPSLVRIDTINGASASVLR
jgi:transcription termination factor Rho